MGGGWNNGPVREPWERIKDFCDDMLMLFKIILVLGAALFIGSLFVGCAQQPPAPVEESPPPVPPTAPVPPDAPKPEPTACRAVENRRTPVLGLLGRATPRIVGGTPASLNQYPWMASIQAPWGAHYCGGTVIDPLHILTAAHCEVLPGDRVVVGRVDLSAGGGEVRTVARAIRHADYNPSTMTDDISLLTLDAPVSALPVTLGEAPQTGAATAIGWGVLNEGDAQTPDALQHVDVPITGNEVCAAAYNGGITAKMVCADGEGRGSCQGDSGGPLIAGGRQAGITSFGVGCARAEWPGVYTRVSSYADWIEACAR
ncbi:MAG: hypothetical protein HMLKMBBP_01496 [Planctomycetes bacterium]|nr:hypothetical protein [Planctomycetota bacterium]